MNKNYTNRELSELFDKIDTLSNPLNASATESFDYTASLS